MSSGVKDPVLSAILYDLAKEWLTSEVEHKIYEQSENKLLFTRDRKLYEVNVVDLL